MKNTNKEIKKLIFLIILLITLSLGATYAYLNLKASSNNPQGEAGCFEVEYTAGQNISSSNLSATTNYLEGAKTTMELSKSTNCDIYTTANIRLHTNTSTTTIPINSSHLAFKYKILNGSTITAEGSITSATEQDGSDLILLKDLSLTTTKTPYTIYLWVDSNLSIREEYDNKKYSGYIYAESTQTSTIEN